VVLEGEMGDKFYIILQGRVSVFKGVKSEIGSIILVSLHETHFAEESSRFKRWGLVWRAGS